MKKILKVAAIAALTAAILTGCGGVDKERLAELTGDKNLNQVKKAYLVSILQEKPEDRKIYAYWLEENGEKADPTFSAENYEKKCQMDYDKGISKLNAEMKKFQAKADKLIKENRSVWRLQRKIRNEERSASFMAFSMKFIKDQYIPFLEKLDNELDKHKK